MTENFYRDIAALKEREMSHAGRGRQDRAVVQIDEKKADYSSSDLNGWVIDQLNPHSGDSILDIGIGSGNRALQIAQAVNYTGYVLAIDRAFEALQTLSQQSLKASLEERIRFLQLPLDEINGHLREGDFDRAVSSRVLARVRHPRTVFNALHLALKPGGLFFFYGPSRKNNLELKRFSAILHNGMQESREPTFMEGIGLQCTRDFFSQVSVVKFEQTLRLDSPEALYTCWCASNLYNEALDRSFRQAAVGHFEFHAVFETTQRIIGIKATN